MQSTCLNLADRLNDVSCHLPALVREFDTQGYCVVRGVFGPEEVKGLVNIWDDSLTSVRRRNVTVTYADITSTRLLDTVNARSLDELTSEIGDLYSDEELTALLSKLAGEDVVPLEDELEKYVFNALSAEGDHHGEHFDSFPFACTISLEQPLSSSGGHFEIAEPNEGGRFRRVELTPGCLVFFRSSQLAHRVTSIGAFCRRLVISMAYATPTTSSVVSNTRDLMYGED